MTVVALAVVPATPLLLPVVAGRSEQALDEMRTATHRAVRKLLAARPDEVLVLGSDTGPTTAGMGVPLGEGPDESLAFTLGRWLFRENGWDGTVVVRTVSETGSAGRYGTAADRLVVLVLADGTNRRGPKSPGADDPRAEGFDALVLRAIRSDDPVEGLRALQGDPVAAPLGVTAFGPLSLGFSLLGGERWSAETLYDAAPFGVGSFVVVRTRA